MAIFIVPVLFVLISKVSYGRKGFAYLKAHHEDLLEKEKVVEMQRTDAELEFDIKEEEKDKEEEDKGKPAE